MIKFYFKTVLFLMGANLAIAQSTEAVSVEVIKNYLMDSGIMNQEDVQDLKIQSKTFSKSMNVTNVYVVQQYKGVPIKNAIGSFVLQNGKVVYFRGDFFTNISSKINTISYSISPVNAVKKISHSLGLEMVNGIRVIDKKAPAVNSFVLSKGNISNDEIPVELVYELKNDKLILCWDVCIHTRDGKNWHSIRIDANTGEGLSKNDLILHCSFDNHSKVFKKTSTSSVLKNETIASAMLTNPVYNVFPIPIESPNHGERQLISGKEDPKASPFGWHDIDGFDGADFTTTQGNNVYASEDQLGKNKIGKQPDGGANLVFDYPYDPSATVGAFQNASITNLFYMNNVIHDVWYRYGFDESSGNFQVNNYGKEDGAKDPVIAEAQDGSGSDNASFGTPADGNSPRMQMFLWNTSPKLKFKVNNTDLEGIYNVVNNSFKNIVSPPILPNSITEDLVLAIDDDPTDGVNNVCSDLINEDELKGKVAVVRRGECNFTAKIRKCQNAGALAVIVVNNEPGDFDMGEEGISSLFFTIPSVAINQKDGEALIAEMALSVVNVSLASIDPYNYMGVDGAFDNGIIMHEYGHGISNRLVAGSKNVDCLFNVEQMGEGWSDWFALMLTIKTGDKGTDSRRIGTFAKNQPNDGSGLRKYPYNVDLKINPVTYDDVKNEIDFSIPHGIGSIWASILWDMTWAFIERDGFDSDLYEGTGGNNLAMHLVINGLKILNCSPGFVDGRDAILKAAELMPNSDDNKCIIWNVFAKEEWVILLSKDHLMIEWIKKQLMICLQ